MRSEKSRNWTTKTQIDLSNMTAFGRELSSLRLSAVTHQHHCHERDVVPSRAYIRLPANHLSRVCVHDGQMRLRLGDEYKPSLALLQRHFQWMVKFLNNAYLRLLYPGHRVELAWVALTNLAAWLGWLRAIKVFSLS